MRVLFNNFMGIIVKSTKEETDFILHFLSDSKYLYINNDKLLVGRNIPSDSVLPTMYFFKIHLVKRGFHFQYYSIKWVIYSKVM